MAHTTGFTVYHNPQCTKSSKSTALFKENQEKGNYELDVIKYKETSPSREALKILVDYLGMKTSNEGLWKEDRPWGYSLRI